MSFTDVHEDPETAGAARALDRVLRDRYFARARQAFEERRAQPDELARGHGHGTRWACTSRRRSSSSSTTRSSS